MNMLELKKQAKAASADYQASILARKQGVAPITEEDLSISDDTNETSDDVNDVPAEDQFEDQDDDTPDDEDVEEETSPPVAQSTTINNTPFLAVDTSTALDQALDDDDDDIGSFVDVPPEPMDMPEESDDEPVEEDTEPPQTAFERPEIYSKPAAQKKPQEKPSKAAETAEKKEKKKATALSAYGYAPSGAREVPKELVDMIKTYFPSCNNQSLAVGAYILLHEGMPKNLQDTPDIFYETAREYVGPVPGATSADTVEDIEDLKTEIQRLRTDNRNLMHKLETIELAVAFLLVQYNAAIPTNTDVEKLKFSGDKVDEVIRNLSAAAVNKSISDKHNSGRPIR